LALVPDNGHKYHRFAEVALRRNQQVRGLKLYWQPFGTS